MNKTWGVKRKEFLLERGCASPHCSSKDVSVSSTTSEDGTEDHPQSGSESGSEESCPSMVSHIASCRDVR